MKNLYISLMLISLASCKLFLVQHDDNEESLKKPLENSLTTENPSQSASDLFNRLKSHWNNNMLSGSTSDVWDQVHNQYQKQPSVRAFDMQNYSPHNPWHEDWSPWDDGTVQSAIDWYYATGQKGIVSFQWHWFSPMGGNQRTSTFYTWNTNFDVSRGVTQGTEEYKAIIGALDAIANQLKRLRDAGVPILWRPLHEAGGKWFWWGAKSNEDCKKLYRIMRDRFINTHGLNNLIWVWSTPESDWYPGNDVVDLIGYDSYPGSKNYDCNKNMFYSLGNLSGWQKMIALSECGPIPNIDQCYQDNSKWLYFLTWGSLTFDQNDDWHLSQVYKDGRVKTLENI